MATVEVEVDMSDLETYELVDEICSRFKLGKASRKALTDKQKIDLKTDLQPIFESLFGSGDLIEVKTLEDKMKYEHIASVWNKYTSSQIEKLLP